MNHLKPNFSLTLVCILLMSTAVFSQKVEDWPYDRLFKESDVVMIGAVQGWRDVDEKWTEKKYDQERFKAVSTAFSESSILKGESLPLCIWVNHFCYQKGAVRYNDGPRLVTFLREPVLIELKQMANKKGKLSVQSKGLRKISQPEYLLFLKKRKDGNYEPVSGQLDAHASVRALLPADHISQR
ncbi:MAG: hypothetical protein VX438_09610 [Planctomycetota bacterium]|nr:hypothetical protein [Planctomycetota bacterium]